MIDFRRYLQGAAPSGILQKLTVGMQPQGATQQINTVFPRRGVPELTVGMQPMINFRRYLQGVPQPFNTAFQRGYLPDQQPIALGQNMADNPLLRQALAAQIMQMTPNATPATTQQMATQGAQTIGQYPQIRRNVVQAPIGLW